MTCELPERRRLKAIAGLGFLFLLSAPAVAEPTEAPDSRSETLPTRVFIDCTRLAPDEAAAVEARSRTELLVQQAPAGTLRLVCTDADLQATWSPDDGSPPETERRTSDQRAALTDELVTLASVVIDRSVRRPPAEEAPPERPPNQASEAPPPPPRTGAVASRPAPAVSSAQAMARPPEAARTEVSDEPERSPEVPALPPNALVLGVGVDTCFTEIAGTAGPFAGVVLPAAPGLALRASAGMGFGLNQVRGISVRHVVVSAGVEVTATRWLVASLAAGVSNMNFAASSATPDGASASTAPFLEAALRLVPRATSNHFTLGPVLRYVGTKRQVTLDEQEVLRPPTLWGALELEGRFEL